MPLVIPAGFANLTVTILNTNGGLSAESSIGIGVDVAAPLDQANFNGIANVVRDGIKVIWDNTWNVGPIHGVENAAGVLKVWDDATVEAGTAPAQIHASPAVSIVASKFTGLQGRRHRGRAYLPGVPETLVDEAGNLDATFRSDVETALNNMNTALVALTQVDAVVMFHDSSTPGSLAPDPFSWVVRSVVGTMRPRQRR